MENKFHPVYDAGRLVAVSAHARTNHLYDGYLPYEFHLRMVVAAGKRFIHLLPQDSVIQSEIFEALWNHDRIEDTRATYNDLAHEISQRATGIVYAVTDEKGRNREERHSGKFWPLLRMTEFADFVKLCDRIGNVKYGALVGGSMFEKYRKENPEFLRELGITSTDHKYWPMAKYLAYLFEREF